jgi:hypothetical protein
MEGSCRLPANGIIGKLLLPFPPAGELTETLTFQEILFSEKPAGRIGEGQTLRLAFSGLGLKALPRLLRVERESAH